MITTLKGFIEVVQSIDEDNVSFFYRGQCNEYVPLPSVFRDGLIKKEDYLYHELILRCSDVFAGVKHLDTLVMMQHYGLPTRLLDVTTNPLVALYFACRDYSRNREGESGYIYIYGVHEESITYSDSDRVLMLSCLPVFSYADKVKMRNIIIHVLKDRVIEKNKDNTYPAAIERLYHEIAKEVPAFKRNIKPIDLIKPLVVKPTRTNARILKQDGAFIISGLYTDKQEAEERISQMCSKKLEIGNRKNILKELDSFGINEASLFPEVDKVASYLVEKCK